MLFIAHHIKEHFRYHGDTGFLKPGDCRLILPIANKNIDAEHTDIDSADSDSSTNLYMPGYVNPTDFFSVECGMFPLSSSMEKQAAPAPHLVFADAEMVGHPDNYTKAELRLASKTKALFFNQHNRRFAWGLTVSNRTIHAYIFGPDDIWASTAMDISGEKGRRAFISLLVDWSLCSVDRLGFDPSIRYIVDRRVGGPYLEIDVHEMDRSTGKAEPRTYYSQRCLGATDHLFGCHARYFAASDNPESMDKPAFLIKDLWMTTGGSSADDSHESLFLNVLHAEFDKSNKFSDSFVQLVGAGPVVINRGKTVVADSTDTAFAGLPSMTQDVAKDSDNDQGSPSRCVRQHRRTMAKWTGNMISEADNESQAIVAVADAMVALNAMYTKCKILHGNISNRAILLQPTASGVKGVLAEFDYASYDGDSAGTVEVPELMLFQSIRCLENPRDVRTLLDDLESILYLVCWLGTFGVNQDQRAAYAVEYAARNKPHLPIKNWNRGTAADIADTKRLHMSSFAAFEERILNRMQNPFGTLSHLAEDIYRVLFLHPGCSGTCPVPNRQVRDVGMPVAVPAPGVERDPLVLRNNHIDAIIANLLDVLARHSDVAHSSERSRG
ncbi:hypothetical protein GGI08_003363 [Coemansia sp. S2]|nr:hypothetical protein GGI08_003363 [Coemansia sp. S2]KAJ2101994.1 hypothetical protein GGI16_003312 [Coemansia sp. S142-1]